MCRRPKAGRLQVREATHWALSDVGNTAAVTDLGPCHSPTDLRSTRIYDALHARALCRPGAAWKALVLQRRVGNQGIAHLLLLSANQRRPARRAACLTGPSIIAAEV